MSKLFTRKKTLTPKLRASKKDEIKTILLSDVKGLFKRNVRGRMSEIKVNELADKLDKV